MSSALAVVTMCIRSFPCNCINITACTKNRIKYNPNIAVHTVIHVHINTPILRQQAMDQFQPLVHHTQVGGDAPLPGIAVGDLFEHRLGFGGRLAVDLDGVAEVGPDGEGRVDVYEFEAALGFDLVA